MPRGPTKESRKNKQWGWQKHYQTKPGTNNRRPVENNGTPATKDDGVRFGDLPSQGLVTDRVEKEGIGGRGMGGRTGKGKGGCGGGEEGAEVWVRDLDKGRRRLERRGEEEGGEWKRREGEREELRFLSTLRWWLGQCQIWNCKRRGCCGIRVEEKEAGWRFGWRRGRRREEAGKRLLRRQLALLRCITKWLW